MACCVRTDSGEQYTWYINSINKKPSLYKSFYNKPVVFLMADGDELERIRTLFNNIPITTHNMCIWKGELAQFIFDNL